MNDRPSDRDRHPRRHFPVAVSAAVQALAWARQEHAPEGAAVTVDQEIAARGFHGRVWPLPAESTVACAVVLRPSVAPEQVDIVWLIAGLAASEAAEACAGRPVATCWPDAVVDGVSGEVVGATRVDVELGPGEVRSAVATVRFDLDALGLDASHRDELLAHLLGAFDRWLAVGISAGEIAATYGERCRLLERRLKIRLLPKGETRGTARSVDERARLEVVSATGMVEHVTVDMLDGIEMVAG